MSGRGVRVVACLVMVAMVAGACLAAAVTKPAAAPQKGEVLSYCDQEGTRASYDFSSTGTAKLVLNDGTLDKATFGMKMRVATEYLGLSPEDGTIRVQGTVLSGSASFKTKKEKGSEQFEPAMTNYDIKPTGEIKYEEEASGEAPNLPDFFVSYGPSDIFLVSGAGIFPKTPVKVGSAWKGVASLPMSTEGEGNETMQLKYGSKILGRETYAGRSCYKIKTNYRVFLSEDIPMEGVEGSARVKGQGTGAATWLFDPAAKVVVRTATTDTLAITALVDIVTMGEGQHEIRVTTSSQTSARLAELNGEAVAGK